jgi:phage baseplate assembly protein W|tara:strand:+ start:226 stop:636 length:411 start_codon:yes stop_codon:yes gene_type:complete
MNKKSFLGTGWSFPPQFNKNTGSVSMVSDEEDIKQSLNIYFNTMIGERIMRPKYGCVIHDKQFEKISDNILQSLTFEMTTSIGKIEPRITVIDLKIIKLDVNSGYIEIKLDYSIISTNIRDNIVFPYYINEGTHIN